jgi:lysophospholipid acyltransferase (LPLAT)-like uncharacterized protein
MAKFKFKTRELFTRYPVLDRLRTNFFVWWCHHGIDFVDRIYNRMRIVSREARPYVVDERPALYAIYHGSMIALLNIRPRKKTTVLISNSRDGEIIARGLHGVGLSTARGSAGRGGVKGTLELIDAARQGRNIVFMVDGPRGPRHDVKIGVIRIAQLTGLPIIPVGYSARSAWHPNSWDRFNGCSFFTGMATAFGDPIRVPENASEHEMEKLRAELEASMRELTSDAEAVWRVDGEPKRSGVFTY